MKIYIACPIPSRSDAIKLALMLSMKGFEVTSRWLLNEEMMPQSNSVDKSAYCKKWCAIDEDDLLSADTVIVINAGTQSTGGTHVELGMALALGKPVIAVGDRPNVFFYHPCVQYFDHADKAVDHIQQQVRMGVKH